MDAGNIKHEMTFVLHYKKDDKAMPTLTEAPSVPLPPRTGPHLALLLTHLLSGSRRQAAWAHHQGSLRPSVIDIVGLRRAILSSECVTLSPSIAGMKIQMQDVLPWLFWAWCFSHRLKLACKNAFKNPLFAAINEMLLCLFYLYKKLPKNTQELAAIRENLKEVFLRDEMHPFAAKEIIGSVTSVEPYT